MKTISNNTTTSTQTTFTCKFTNLKLFSYAGSKYSFKQQFHNVINKMGVKKVKVYIEAFAGSLASLFHNIELIQADKIVINDLNPKLINFYKQIKENPELVYLSFEMIEKKFHSLKPTKTKELRLYPKDKRDEITELPKFYKYIRTILNNNDFDYTNAASWLFVMNHNFNGLYNENKKGNMNIAFNWSTLKLDLEKTKESIFKLSDFFNTHNVEFENLDVDELINKYNDHDTFIYLDPPYINTKIQYSQSREGKKKNKNSFQNIDTHLKMIDKCSKYKYVMYSNNHDDGFINSFDGYINFSRSANVSNKKSSKSKLEILAYKVNKKTQSNIKASSIPVNNNLDLKNIINDKKITSGTICSGCGASEEALRQLGFNESNHRNLFMCEWDDKVSDVYKMNFKSENYFKDFYEVDWSRVEKIKLNLLILSCPCQEFSIASGKRRGLESQRGQLYIDALIQARKLNPDKIINENVGTITSSGKHYSLIKDENGNKKELNYIPTKEQLEEENWELLESQKNKYVYKSKFNPNLEIGRTLKIVEDILISDFSDYNIYMEILNTKDFNTPQNRRRFFLVMIKKDLDLGFKYPQKQELTTFMSDLLEKNVDEKYFLDHREFIAYNDPKPENPKQLYLYGEQLKKNGERSNHRSSRSVYFTDVSPCLTTKNPVKIFIDERVRVITPLEMVRLQAFSDKFVFPDNYGLVTHIMGNTISVSVMKELMRNILFMNTQHHQSNTIDYQGQEETLVS